MKTLLALLLLIAAGAGLFMPAAASGQTVLPAASKPAAAAPAPAPVLTPAQAQGVLDVLQNDQKRAQFIAVLQNMAKVQAATAPKTAGIPLKPGSLGAELLVTASGQLGRASAAFIKTARSLTHVTLFWVWIDQLAHDPARRGQVVDAAWKLSVLAVAAGFAQWLTLRALAPWRRSIHASAQRDDAALPVTDAVEPAPPLAPEDSEDAAVESGPPGRHGRRAKPSNWALLRRVPYVLLRLLVALLPVGVFGMVIYAALATPLGDVQQSRLVILALTDAYIAVAAAMVCIEAMLAPEQPALRLIHLSDRSAAYLTRWARRILVVAIFGYAIDQTGLLFGMYDSVHDGLIKLVALIIHVFALVMVLQCRAKVARRLRAPKRAHGAWAAVRNRFAEIWHVIAIFYIVAFWMIFAFEVQNGYALVWRYFLIGLATLIVARLVSIVLLGALDRSLRLRPETVDRFPGIDERAARYHPALRLLINWLVTAAALLVLLELWGVPVSTWLRHGSLGGRIADALGASALIVILAVLIWEALNTGIQAHLARLSQQQQFARSARLRTLLPMLRTTLLSVIFVFAALMVLSEIGINTAPLLAGAGVVGIAIGFGSQKLVQDVITGLFLLLENTMQVGDTVSLASLTGTVETLSIRTIRLRAIDGAVHVIPFSAVTTVSNSTRDYGYAMLDVTAGYNEEPDHISAILREVAADLRADPQWRDSILADVDILGVDKFLDNAWVLRARVKTAPARQWAVQREFNRRLKYRFDELAIESPFTSPRILSTNPPAPVDPEPSAAAQQETST